MRTVIMSVIAILLAMSAVQAKTELKTCSANRSYCEGAAKKHGWTRPAAFTVCMGSGEWHTSGPFRRTLSNVERR